MGKKSITDYITEYWIKVYAFTKAHWQWVIGALLLLLLLSWCSGCATAKARDLDKNYLAYLEAVRTPPKILEIEGIPGQSIELKGISKFVVYGVISTQIEQLRIPPSTGAIVARELFGFLKGAAPYALGWKALDTIETGITHAGGNIADSYNTTDSYKTMDSYNTPTTTTTTNTATLDNSFNGDNREIGGDNDAHSDRHDVNDSYNDRHDSVNDNHAVSPTL